jgi:cytochrome P450
MVMDDTVASDALAWDPSDPAWVSDPYPVYARLRERGPVRHGPLGFWVFARHADCLSILRDRRAGSEGRSGATPDELVPFIFRDPPDHTRLRGLVAQAFTPRVIQSLQPRIEAICAELLDAAVQRREVDLVADYAYPLPVRIITELLGVPTGDQTLFHTWSDALARGLDPDFLLPPDAVTQRAAGLLSFVQYFTELIAHRRDHPADDLISRLIQVEQQGDTLSQAELIAMCLLLLVAGHETTVSLISGGALALMQHPDQLARLRDDPAVARSGIEELLRFVSPVQLTTRVALAEMRVGDVVLPEGERCLVLIGSANRDPGAFIAPDTLELGRADNPHLGFGLGIHHCLGAPLARIEARAALGALLRRTGRMQRTTSELSYKPTLALRGLASLPVTLTAA